MVGLANLGVYHRVILGLERKANSPHRVGNVATEGDGGIVLGVDGQPVALAEATHKEEVGVVLDLEGHGAARGQEEGNIGMVFRNGHAVVFYLRHLVLAGGLEHRGAVGGLHHEANSTFEAYLLHMVRHLLSVGLLGVGD